MHQGIYEIAPFDKALAAPAAAAASVVPTIDIHLKPVWTGK